MKIMIFAFDGLSMNSLINDDRLENFHRLMEYGCYGEVEQEDEISRVFSTLSDSWLDAARQGKQVIFAGEIPDGVPQESNLSTYRFQHTLAEDEDIGHSLHSQFNLIAPLLQDVDWDCIIFHGNAPIEVQASGYETRTDDVVLSDYQYHLDIQLGNTLKLLDDKVVILIISMPFSNSDHPGFFIMAGSNNPLSGELEGVKLIDLTATLFDLGGFAMPNGILGRSLVSGLSLEEISSDELTEDEEAILRERLSGLGYIS